jgi:hypothetical protein
MGLNSVGRTGNKQKTIHSGSTFVRIKCFANCMCLIKKTFLIRLFLSSHSSPLYPSSSNSFHSTIEFSIIIRKSESANCSLIATAPVAISNFKMLQRLG